MSKFQPGDLVKVINSGAYKPYQGERARVLAVGVLTPGGVEVDLPSPSSELQFRDGGQFMVHYASGPHGGAVYYETALQKLGDDYDGGEPGAWDEVPWRPARLGFIVDERS